jgi:hypothetical protein
VLRCWGTRHAPKGRSVVIRGAGVVRQAVEVDDRWCARDDAGVVRCWRWSARAPALRTLDVGGAATRLFPGSGRWHGDYHEPSTLLLVRADGKLVGCRWEGDVADTAAFCEEVGDARGLVGARTTGNDSSTWWSGGVRRDPGDGDEIPAEPALRDAVDVQEAAVTCGLLRDGTVVCSGRDREGQLADGEAPPEEARPRTRRDPGGAMSERRAAS